MPFEFIEEELPKLRYIFKLSRFKVPGGWYVRVIFTNFGHGAGGNSESALFIPDLNHSWCIDGFCWEFLKAEPMGGIYRAQVPGGWMLMSTAQGTAKTDHGIKYRPRMGTLVFIPDCGQEWDCSVHKEGDPVFKNL